MNTHRLVRLFTVLLMLLFFQNCDEPDPQPIERFAGDFISASTIHQYSSAEILPILAGMGLTDSGPIPNSIQSMKIKYMSPDHNNQLRELSGALIYPEDNLAHPLMSIQHGTVTKRTAVASVNPMNSSAGMSGLFTASQGYVTLVPDYAGFGDSHDMHPYMHAESLANSVIDFMRAARTYCAEQDILLNEELYLTGYSEGGFASLASQKKMETELSDEFSLTATAPMAGPYDLHAIARHILQGNSYNWPTYIGFMFVAYDEIYAFQNLTEVFDSPYDQQIAGFFNGENEFSEINNQLPQSITDLIRFDFLESFIDGSELEYSAAFEENSLLGWAPATPTRFYHGMADSTVPYFIAEATVADLIANGAEEVELVGIPDANHSTAGIPAILAMLEWFSTYQINPASTVDLIQ